MKHYLIRTDRRLFSEENSTFSDVTTEQKEVPRQLSAGEMIFSSLFRAIRVDRNFESKLKLPHPTNQSKLNPERSPSQSRTVSFNC
jgi:hypothetical protein